MVQLSNSEDGALMSAHAQARLDFLGQLAGSVSHAIRNPLSAVSLHADILTEELSRSRDSNREQLLDSLAVIQAGVTRMRAIVQHYLTLARLSVVSRLPEDVGAFLEACHHDTRQRLASHNIALHLEGLDNLGLVALDTTICHQVLLHLVENVTEVLPRGGTVTVYGRETDGVMHLDIRVAADEVRDTDISCSGLDVPPAETEGWEFAVFLARELIVAHQGGLALSSKPGTEITITVTLPLVEIA